MKFNTGIHEAINCLRETINVTNSDSKWHRKPTKTHQLLDEMISKETKKNYFRLIDGLNDHAQDKNRMTEEINKQNQEFFHFYSINYVICRYCLLRLFFLTIFSSLDCETKTNMH